MVSLHWEGLQHSNEVKSLRQCIALNRPHMKSLSLGFVPSQFAQTLCWEDLCLDENSRHDENDDLDLLTGPTTHLSSLSLFRITLPLNNSPRASSIFWSLQALMLRSCPNQLRLLRHLSQSGKRLRLKHFEACFDYMACGGSEYYDSVVPEQFLCSFQGLESLHLRLANFPASCHAERAVRHHSTTLQTFMYHERQLASVDDRGIFEDERDVPPRWLTDLSTVIDSRLTKALALSASPHAVVSR